MESHLTRRPDRFAASFFKRLRSLSCTWLGILCTIGDTVYYKGVEQALEQYRPDVVVLNACGAELMGLGRLIMGDEDVLKVCEAINDPAARLLSLLFCMAK